MLSQKEETAASALLQIDKSLSWHVKILQLTIFGSGVRKEQGVQSAGRTQLDMNCTRCPLGCSAPAASVFLMSRTAWPLAARLPAAESCSHSVRAHLANNLEMDAHTCVCSDSHCVAIRASISLYRVFIVLVKKQHMRKDILHFSQCSMCKNARTEWFTNQKSINQLFL